jgi:lipid-A-disaccharide synthase
LSSGKHVFLVAAEASGDAIGADVIDTLRAKDPSVRISGIGGDRMRERGVASAMDMSGLAVLGFVEGIKAYGRVKAKVAEAADIIAKADPDAVVLIDSWGFMWRLAKALKEKGARAKRIKLIGPQVWATRPGRARVLAQWCDHLLCIHAFEQPFYEKWGLPTTVIGNPALSRLPKGDGAAFRARHHIPDTHKVVGVLPGSRRHEIRRVAPTLFEAARQLYFDDMQHRQVICVEAGSIATELEALTGPMVFPFAIVKEDEKADAFAAMDIALACSGTVTTELAGQGAAVIVGYRLGAVTYAIAKSIFKAPYITMMNIAAGEEVAPEFLQDKLTAANLRAAASRLLTDPATLATQRRKQEDALKAMAGPGRPAAEISAETILELA